MINTIFFKIVEKNDWKLSNGFYVRVLENGDSNNKYKLNYNK